MQAPDRTVATDAGVEIGVHTSGEGPPVVLVHGTACDHRVWARVARRLEDRFTVHAVDRRGRGTSSDASTYAFGDEAGDVAAVCRKIADEAGQPASVVGHSLGGVVALEAAARVEVARVAAYEPPLQGEAGADLEEADALEALLETEGPEAVAEAFLAHVGYGPDQLERLKRNEAVWASTVEAAPTIPREARAMVAYEPDPFLLSKVEAPVWLGVGGDSPPVYRDAVARVRSHLNDVTVEVIEDAGHAVHAQAPGRFVDALVSFLTRTRHGRS